MPCMAIPATPADPRWTQTSLRPTRAATFVRCAADSAAAFADDNVYRSLRFNVTSHNMLKHLGARS